MKEKKQKLPDQLMHINTIIEEYCNMNKRLNLPFNFMNTEEEQPEVLISILESRKLIQDNSQKFMAPDQLDKIIEE